MLGVSCVIFTNFLRILFVEMRSESAFSEYGIVPNSVSQGLVTSATRTLTADFIATIRKKKLRPSAERSRQTSHSKKRICHGYSIDVTSFSAKITGIIKKYVADSH